jgi:hypothetical protein
MGVNRDVHVTKALWPTWLEDVEVWSQPGDLVSIHIEAILRDWLKINWGMRVF